MGLEKGHEYGQRDGVPLLQRQADVLPQQVGGSEKFEIPEKALCFGHLKCCLPPLQPCSESKWLLMLLFKESEGL